MTSITDHLKKTREQIAAFETKYHREPQSVFLLVVSKKQSIEKIQEAISAGQYAFGENYLQEALPKIYFFKSQNIEWHFIGHIQNNKTRKIAEHFDWVHSVAEMKTAQRLNDQRSDLLPPLNICLEVNINLEATKTGVIQEQAFELAHFCANLPRLKLRGLMGLPAPLNDFHQQCENFDALSTIFKALKNQYATVDTLSMGTSGDLEAAIASGSTLVRIGTAIFGLRV